MNQLILARSQILAFGHPLISYFFCRPLTKILDYY